MFIGIVAYFIVGVLVVIAIILDEIMGGEELNVSAPRVIMRIVAILIAWPVWAVVASAGKAGEWLRKM
jgi:hypothetical protein